MSVSSSDILTTEGMRRLVARMGEAAADLIASLAPDQRARLIIPFSDQETRTFWDYIPMYRKGLSLGEMEYPQRRLAHRLVTTGLSRSGFVTASTIIGLETALDAIEGWTRPHEGRDTGNYYLSLFGTPSDTEPWGWKFEGHHISLNYTIVRGMIVAPTPTFFGSNPAEAALSGVASLRPLSGVEDIARELVRSMSEEQKSRAVLSSMAPSDILTVNQPFVAESSERHERVARNDAPYEAVRFTQAPRGLAAGALNESQRQTLRALIREYIDRMPDAIAEVETARLERMGIDTIHIAWAGGLERRQPHYYRLHSPRFLVEYDNTQNDANHIHSVWRDPVNDFGADLIAHHYRTSHGHG